MMAPATSNEWKGTCGRQRDNATQTAPERLNHYAYSSASSHGTELQLGCGQVFQQCPENGNCAAPGSSRSPWRRRCGTRAARSARLYTVLYTIVVSALAP